MPSISLIIPTLNEEKNLQRCLDSVKGLADEVVILDSFSEDNTIKIAEQHNCRIEQLKWMGFGPTKNYGGKIAQHSLLIFLDADEELSPELRQNILSQKHNLSGVYACNRLNFYCGRWIRFGGFYPDAKIRIWEKGKARWSTASVHEKVEVLKTEKVKKLKGDILHYSYFSYSEHDVRLKKYAALAAADLIQQQASLTWAKQFLSPFWKFCKHYFLKAGFLDGRQGFWLTWYSAKEVYLKYHYAFKGLIPQEKKMPKSI